MKHTTSFRILMSLCADCHSLTWLVIFVESLDSTHSLFHPRLQQHKDSFIFRAQNSPQRNRQ
jgi:hypothetical protein